MNNRKHTKGRVKQVVLSQPEKIFVEDYISPKGLRLVAAKEMTKKEAKKIYGKKRYRKNPDAVGVRTIQHLK